MQRRQIRLKSGRRCFPPNKLSEIAVVRTGADVEMSAFHPKRPLPSLFASSLVARGPSLVLAAMRTSSRGQRVDRARYHRRGPCDDA